MAEINGMERLLQYNAPSHFVRSTAAYLPMTAALAAKAGVGVGVWVQPLAPTPRGAREVATVDFGNGAVVRCKRCRTYVNPFVSWHAAGRRWQCNMCSLLNDTPTGYVAAIDERGQRLDRHERAELCQGSVDFLAPADYMVRPPQPPCYVFVLDATQQSLQSGLFAAACEHLTTLLGEQGGLPGGERTLVGLVCFDAHITFFDLAADDALPAAVVVSDVGDVFTPLASGLLVPLVQRRATLLRLLAHLPGHYAATTETQSCLCAAIKAAGMVAKAVGGKLVVLAGAPPSVGDGAVDAGRAQAAPTKAAAGTLGAAGAALGSALSAVQGTGKPESLEQETAMLRSATEAYRALAGPLVQAQLSVDLFLCGAGFMDAASIIPVAKHTGGSAHVYPGFSAARDGARLGNELRLLLTAETGWEAVMRFRVSGKWRIADWGGSFYFRGHDLLVLPNVGEHQSFNIALEQDGAEPAVFVQAALLYTSSRGERRIRVHTVCLPTTNSLGTLMQGVDPPVLALLMAKKAVQTALRGKLADGRAYLQNALAAVLQAGEAQTLVLCVLGALKSALLSKAEPPDARAALYLHLDGAPAPALASLFYPQLYALDSLAPTSGLVDEYGHTSMPPLLNLSAEAMHQDGVYLLDDGRELLLWVGRGAQTRVELHNAEWSLRGGAEGERVGRIIDQLRLERRPRWPALRALAQGAPEEAALFAALIEDRTHQVPLSFTEFLAKVSPKLKPADPTTFQAPGLAQDSQYSAPTLQPTPAQPPTTTFNAYASGAQTSFQAPTATGQGYGAPVAAAQAYQAPTAGYQAPPAAQSYQAPTAGQAYQAPQAAQSYQAPTAGYQAPTAGQSYPAPPAAQSYQAPPAAQSYQAPPAAQSYQAPPAGQSYQAPQAGQSYQTIPPGYQPAGQAYQAPPAGQAQQGMPAPHNYAAGYPGQNYQ